MLFEAPSHLGTERCEPLIQPRHRLSYDLDLVPGLFPEDPHAVQALVHGVEALINTVEALVVAIEP